MLSEQKSIPSLLLLCFVEAWERFSYYGMRALLALYLISALGFSDAKAYAIYSLFAAIGYAIPPFAGMLADKYLGFQKMIIIGSILMCIGHSLMGLTVIDQFYIYLGLPFIAVGTGFFKGNVTNLLGTLYEGEKRNSKARDKGFSIFYVSINLGSASAALICGYCAHKFGWHYGFALAGLGMLLGLCTFLKFRHILGDHGLKPAFNENPEHIKALLSSTVLLILSFIIIYNSEGLGKYFSYLGILILGLLIKVYINSTLKEKRRITILITLSFFLFCFFALEMQLGALINLFTERNVDRVVFGYEIPASTLQAINPFAILICGPFLANYLARLNKNGPLARFSVGLFLNILCFLVIYIGCVRADSGKAALIYLFISVIFMSLVELFISPLLQSLFVVFSPEKYRGLMMGIFMFSLSFANIVAIYFGNFMSIPQEISADTLASMNIYQNVFYRILFFNTGLFGFFLLLLPFLYRLYKKT